MDLKDPCIFFLFFSFYGWKLLEINQSITPSYLSGSSSEVFLQHSQLDDVAWMSDNRHYGNRVTASDVAVKALHTVETERAGHPQPGLLTHIIKARAESRAFEKRRQQSKQQSEIFTHKWISIYVCTEEQHLRNLYKTAWFKLSVNIQHFVSGLIPQEAYRTSLYGDHCSSLQLPNGFDYPKS